MIQRLFLIISVWLFAVPCYSLDTVYISGNNGDDLDDGSTWALAFFTHGAAIYSGGDTVAIAGDMLESINPSASGTSGANRTVFIDSVRFTDGTNQAPTASDAAWSARFSLQDGAGFTINVEGTDDWIAFIGFTIDSAGSELVVFNTGANGIWMQQCRLWHRGNNASPYLFVNGTNDTIVSNIILGESPGDATRLLDYSSGAGAGNAFYNNTWVGQGNDVMIRFNHNNATGDDITFKNNIVESTNTVATDIGIGHISVNNSGANVIEDHDYNLWYFPNHTTRPFWFDIAITTHAVFQDSVDNYVVGAEANEVEGSDPLLQSQSTLATITSSSPADNAGDDIGFGGDIGVWQVVAAPAGGISRPNIMRF